MSSRLVENCVFRGVSGELYVATNLVCFTGENKNQQVGEALFCFVRKRQCDSMA